MLLIAIVLTLSILLIYKRHQQMTILQRLGIPGPKPNFIFGNSLEIARDNFIGVFPKWTKTYGAIVGFYVGGRPQVLVTDFELIRRIMIKDFNVFSNKHQYIPGGSQGSKWNQLRATTTPSFSSSKLNAMNPLMMSSIDNLLNDLYGNERCGQEFNIRSLIMKFSFSITTKCIFGLNFSMNSNQTENVFKVVRASFNTSILAMTMLLFPSLTFIVHPIRVMWETHRLRMLWSPEGVCYDMAREIVQVRKDTKIKSNDFLQLLVDAKSIRSTDEIDHEMSLEDHGTNNNSLNHNVTSGKLSEEEVLSNAMLFLLAGYETTSTTLQFVIHNLFNNKDVQEKLRKELKELVINESGELNFQTVSKVPLLIGVINETLLIPKGTGVFIGVTSIHNDPKLWSQPEKFQPQRFECEYDKLAFLPFGGGPRNCLGMRFAYMELQLTLAKLLLKFKLEPGPSTEKNIRIAETFATLTPKNGVFCKVSELDE